MDSFLDCLTESGLANVGYAQGFDRQGKADEDLKKEAVALAQNANVVLLCMGLDEIKESEGLDRMDMKLAQNQLDLLAAVAAVNPNVVVLLSAGSSLETPWLKDCKALVYGCLGGQAGAGALVDVLTGTVCPGGKLAETWANAYSDSPVKDHFAGEGRTVQYREGLYVGYRYFETAGRPVAFPFGYGLSYTTFAYKDLKATPEGVTLTVTNTGKCAGAEIVQLYVAKPDAKVFRPAQELKGFARVTLEPGQSKVVTIELGDKAFRYFNDKTGNWEVEGGTWELRVASSSDDVRLTAQVEVAGTDAPNPYEGRDVSCYEDASVAAVSDASFEALLGHPVPADGPVIGRNMCFRDLNHGRSLIFWVVWAVLKALKTGADKSGKPNLNVLFIWNMPLRALAKMTGGMVDMGLVDALVREVRGFGWGGVILLAAAIALGWGVGAGISLWALWILMPILYAFVMNLVKNSGVAKKLA